MGSIDPSCPYQDLLLTDNSRWHRTVQNVYKLKADVWNGDRPKRESPAVMQSILSAVLDYHCRTGRPLGNLGDIVRLFFLSAPTVFWASNKSGFESHSQSHWNLMTIWSTWLKTWKKFERYFS